MEKQIIEISNDGFYLSLSRGFLVIKNDDLGILRKVSLDDILSIILSANDVVISKKLIDTICQNGGTIIFCGKNYTPSAITLPYVDHWLMSSRIRQQLDSSVPLQKNLWKSIVQHKINNQAVTLHHFFPDCVQIERLRWLAKETLSNDAQNNEGQAAAIYFKSLFGKNFVRNRLNDDANILLNYAYTVLRAMVARAVSGNGLLPYLGIKHCNKLNQTPLIDDLIEPFRPIADKVVLDELKKLQNTNPINLTPDIKRALTSIITYPVKTERGTIPLSEAIYDFVASLVKSYELKKVSLKYPQLQYND